MRIMWHIYCVRWNVNLLKLQQMNHMIGVPFFVFFEELLCVLSLCIFLSPVILLNTQGLSLKHIPRSFAIRNIGVQFRIKYVDFVRLKYIFCEMNNWKESANLNIKQIKNHKHSFIRIGHIGYPSTCVRECRCGCECEIIWENQRVCVLLKKISAKNQLFNSLTLFRTQTLTEQQRNKGSVQQVNEVYIASVSLTPISNYPKKERGRHIHHINI